MSCSILSPGCSTVAELFRRRVESSADVETYRIKGTDGEWASTTWSEFAADVDALAAGLATGLGDFEFTPGSAGAVLAECNPQWCVADLAILSLGGMGVGVYPTLLLEQIAFLLSDARCRVLFVQGEEQLARVSPLLDTVTCLERIVSWDCNALADDRIVTLSELQTRGRAALAESPTLVSDRVAAVGSEDVALVVYTSGTTGRPKGVPLTHKNILSGLNNGAELLVEDIGPEDITISFLPMAHVAERVPGFYGRLNTGLRTAYATNYETLLDELQEVRPTYFGAVPRIFEKMFGRIHEEVAKANPRRQAIFRWAKALARRRGRALTGGDPLSLFDRLVLRLADRVIFRKIRAVFGGRVKAFVTGSAPIDVEILEFFTGVGMRVVEVYGMSEATAISFANPLDAIRLGTVGVSLPGVEYKLAADGEILLRGDSVFGGYLNLEEKNAEVFDEEGYLRTGDIGEVDADGYLRLTDRKKNLIKTSGGKYVAPARIEALLKREPIVGQVYVHGDREKYVVALITLDERETPRVAEELGVEPAELANHPEVLRRIEVSLDATNERLARFEQVKRHAVLGTDFSIEEGTLTPTMKIKRRVVAERYADRIAELYV